MPVTNKLTEFPAPLGLILDMDGVLWRENSPIGNLPDVFQRIRSMGLKFILATNNSTKSVEQYQQRLEDFGVHVEPWQIVTSSHAVADMLARKFPERGDIFVIGEDGIKVALQEKGFTIVQAGETQNAIAVVVGIDREINFQKLKEATLLIRRGVPFYGTNSDLTFPTPEGLDTRSRFISRAHYRSHGRESHRSWKAGALSFGIGPQSPGNTPGKNSRRGRQTRNGYRRRSGGRVSHCAGLVWSIDS